MKFVCYKFEEYFVLLIEEFLELKGFDWRFFFCVKGELLVVVSL